MNACVNISNDCKSASAHMKCRHLTQNSCFRTRIALSGFLFGYDIGVISVCSRALFIFSCILN